jgi:putative ABC transport system ATP-binding protein
LPVLHIQDLTYRYAGSARLLRFPDLQADAAASLLLRGPSGSGKSTLLALMAGLLAHQSGVLQVGSADLAHLGPREADAWRGRELGFVPQRLHLSPGLSVADNLALPYLACAQRVDRARIDTLLRRLGLHELRGRRPHQLSVGQAQRVALARAVLRRPRVLLADEPTSNLDDGAAQVVLDLLRELAQEERALLVVATHDARVSALLPQARCGLLTLPEAADGAR